MGKKAGVVHLQGHYMWPMSTLTLVAINESYNNDIPGYVLLKESVDFLSMAFMVSFIMHMRRELNFVVSLPTVSVL